MTTTKARIKRLTHLVIRVRDVERSERFYTEVMGFHITAKYPGMVFYATDDEQTTHDLATQEIGMDAPGCTTWRGRWRRWRTCGTSTVD